MIAWLSKIYGKDVADKVAFGMEYNVCLPSPAVAPDLVWINSVQVTTDSHADPFGKKLNIVDVPGDSNLPPYQD